MQCISGTFDQGHGQQQYACPQAKDALYFAQQMQQPRVARVLRCQSLKYSHTQGVQQRCQQQQCCHQLHVFRDHETPLRDCWARRSNSKVMPVCTRHSSTTG